MVSGAGLESKAVDILFISGWSVKADIAADFINQLCVRLENNVDLRQATVLSVDVPAVALADLDKWLLGLQPYISDKTMIVGWSLGGMLSVRLAYLLEQNRAAYRYIVSLMASPCFLATRHYPTAMPPVEFESFKDVAVDSRELESKFPFMLTAGASYQRQDLRGLKKDYLRYVASEDQRQYGLAMLERLDVTKELERIKPCLLIFGDNDALVSNETAALVQKRYSRHEVRCLADVPHFPFGEAKSLVLDEIMLFIEHPFESAVGVRSR